MFLRIIIISLLLSYATAASLYSQQKQGDLIPGQLIIQLDHLSSMDKIEKSLTFTGLKTMRVLSERLNIVLVEYNPQLVHAEDMLLNIRSKPGVINAQYNHVVELRGIVDNTPDDTMFPDQWNMNNTGQNSGTPGADIDALKAWDITTGGLTAMGDTIVVAVIDGGIEVTHIDLNVFKNHQEIPNNGIDDDQNGYIDDYYGWNAVDNSPNQPSSAHATHVAGIIGAKGNNTEGVAGVNWNVKTLSIAGSSSVEAIVVAAYAYAYEMRSLYDETSGEKGCFIVAINASFGVNQGQPENYPIWEAMIDSLGRIGVLTAGATANLDYDVDQVGDIPTAFETPYLISVTNTTKSDDRYFSAAYGANSIDLGAPGTLILSAMLNNTYNYRTGTSMATPHVAGAIALLFSAADAEFIQNYKANPAEVVLQIKQYILDGTDSISGLVGKSVTGGRLNVYNSLMKLLNAPKLDVNPEQLSCSLLTNNTEIKELQVQNSGGDTLFYTLAIEDQPAWISLGTYNGVLASGMSETILVNFNSEGLDTGFYYCEMSIVSENAGTKTVPVSLEVYTDVSVYERDQEHPKLSIWPNPASSQVNLNITGMNSNVATITISNLSGNILFSTRLPALESGNFELIWPFGDIRGNKLASGMYIVEIVTETHKMRSKFVLY